MEVVLTQQGQVCQGRRALLPHFGDRQASFQLNFLCSYLQKSSPVKMFPQYTYIHCIYDLQDYIKLERLSCHWL